MSSEEQKIQILIPIAERPRHFSEEDYYFPPPLIDLRDRTILEAVVENLGQLASSLRFVFVVPEAFVDRFSFSEIINTLCGPKSEVVRVRAATQGALCSSLLAIDKLNLDQPLVIANCDQIFSCDLRPVHRYFSDRGCQAGVITFEAVHPRWAYVEEQSGEVIRVVEKQVISRFAVAGFYYFSNANVFRDAAFNVLMSKTMVNGRYYVSSTMNEVILSGGRVGNFKIPSSSYHSLYTPERVREYLREAGNMKD